MYTVRDVIQDLLMESEKANGVDDKLDIPVYIAMEHGHYMKLHQINFGYDDNEPCIYIS